MGNCLQKQSLWILVLIAVLVLQACSTSSTKEVAAGCASTDASRTGANSGSDMTGNTGAQSGPAIVSEPRFLWSVPVSGDFYDFSVDKNSVYVTESKAEGTLDLTVYDRFTGFPLWQLPLGTDYLTRSFHGEQMLVVDKGGTLFALVLPKEPWSAELEPMW